MITIFTKNRYVFISAKQSKGQFYAFTIIVSPGFFCSYVKRSCLKSDVLPIFKLKGLPF